MAGRQATFRHHSHLSELKYLCALLLSMMVSLMPEVVFANQEATASARFNGLSDYYRCWETHRQDRSSRGMISDIDSPPFSVQAVDRPAGFYEYSQNGNLVRSAAGKFLITAKGSNKYYDLKISHTNGLNFVASSLPTDLRTGTLHEVFAVTCERGECFFSRTYTWIGASATSIHGFCDPISGQSLE